jgi:hypothetical protein
MLENGNGMDARLAEKSKLIGEKKCCGLTKSY